MQILKQSICYLRHRRLTSAIEKIVKERYYSDPLFKKLDRFLLKTYRLKNPYRISRNFLLEKGDTFFQPYGETPLPTLERIATWSGLTSKDRFLELGSGRGRGAFFISRFFHCQVEAIEWNPFFFSMSQKIAKKYPLVSFYQRNLFEDPWPKADFIYLYGTTFSEEQILLICGKILRETKVITISYPLSDYSPHNFTLIDKISVFFPWGETTAYLQIKN